MGQQITRPEKDQVHLKTLIEVKWRFLLDYHTIWNAQFLQPFQTSTETKDEKMK